jgi:hypothetical protein
MTAYWRFSSTPATPLPADTATRAPFMDRNTRGTGSNLFFWYEKLNSNGPAVSYRSTHFDTGLPCRPAGPLGLAAAPAARAALRVVPNPATSTASLNYSLAPDERVLQVTVINLGTGQVVASVTGDKASSLTLAGLLPAGSRPGLYAARLITTRGTTTATFRFEP